MQRYYGKAGKTEAHEYIRQMRFAVGTHLIAPDGMYYGREGHLRFAREFGVALIDFNKEGQREILSGSYSSVYVIGCSLKPILDAGEWIKEMKRGARNAEASLFNTRYELAELQLDNAGLRIGGRGLNLNTPYEEWFPVFHGESLFGYIDADCSHASVQAVIEKHKEMISRDKE